MEDMVAILLIGDEILSAAVREANLHPMLTTLTEMGYQVGEVRIVRDDEHEIAGALRALRTQYEYLFTSGGIGPTHDDLTLSAAASAFDRPPATHPQMLAFLSERYGDDMTPMVRRMADLPEETEVLGCEEGRWPVIRWRNVFILPGLPRALQDKMERIRTILPHLERAWTALLYLSADESSFADHLMDIQREYPGISIGSYPVVGDYDYRSRLAIRGTDRDEVRRVTDRLRDYVARKGWLVREGGDAEGA